MKAFDRDGTLIGFLGDWEACHPKLINRPEDQNLIPPVADYIRKHGGILISNQMGVANGYTSLDKVIAEFLWLHQQLPQLLASFFCPDNGQSCWMISSDTAEEVSQRPGFQHLAGTYRKPDSGMLQVAQTFFGSIDCYVGDLSGSPTYAGGRDSDRLFAENAGIRYLDVQEFIQSYC